MEDDDETPHARGPEVLGPEDLGPQSSRTSAALGLDEKGSTTLDAGMHGQGAPAAEAGRETPAKSAPSSEVEMPDADDVAKSESVGGGAGESKAEEGKPDAEMVDADAKADAEGEVA